TFVNEIIVAYSSSDQIIRLALALVLEPSAHLPLGEGRVWLAIGVGGGILYNGIDAGALVIPRLGLDVLVGRSAMLHISALFRAATNQLFDALGHPIDGVQFDGGLDLGYAALF